MKLSQHAVGVAGAALGLALFVTQASAGPADYVFLPGVSYGEREIDFKLGTIKQGQDPRESAASLGVGYGVTDYWFTEFYAKSKRADGNDTKFDAF